MSVGAEKEILNNGSSIPTGLPKAGVLMKTTNETAKSPSETEVDGIESEHNTIFDSLVKVEGEVSGLVAVFLPRVARFERSTALAHLHDVIGRVVRRVSGFLLGVFYELNVRIERLR